MSPVLLAGQTLGPYQILALIGAGGMGEVYNATDTRLQRHVAIKVLQSRSTSGTSRAHLGNRPAPYRG